SNTNFAIANGLSQNENPTAEQQQLITTLLQQSLREARLATQLNATDVQNWENLAFLYSQILRVEAAPDWAVASLAQAIQVDPISPQLRIQLGNLYFQFNEKEQALRLYEQAVQLKPDWYVALYQYGNVLKDSGNIVL